MLEHSFPRERSAGRAWIRVASGPPPHGQHAPCWTLSGLTPLPERGLQVVETDNLSSARLTS